MEKSGFSAIMSGSQLGNKLKEKKTQNETVRKERDKRYNFFIWLLKVIDPEIRRRKMIVDQAKSQKELEIKKREEILLSKLEQQSKQVPSFHTILKIYY